MKQVRIRWEAEHDRFTASGSHSGFEIPVNAPHEGKPAGFSASELLLAGAGACSAWDVIEILRKRRQDVDAVDVTVSGEQAAEPPWPYVRLSLHFQVTGRGVERMAVERAVSLSVDKYCSVLATIRGVARIETTIELTEHEPGQPTQDIPASPAGRTVDG